MKFGQLGGRGEKIWGKFRTVASPGKRGAKETARRAAFVQGLPDIFRPTIRSPLRADFKRANAK